MPEDAPLGVLSRKEAEYTEEARLAGVNAMVLVGVTVGADGLLQSLRLLRGAGFGLDESALATLREWRFQPAIKGGLPAVAVANVEVSFRLPVAGQQLWNVSLNFAVPPGGTRPQVVKGHVPVGLGGSGPQHIRVAPTVGAEGFPTAVAIVESTSPEGSAQVLREFAGWQFRPGTINGQAWEMKGAMDLSTDGVLPVPLPAASRSRSMVSISPLTRRTPLCRPLCSSPRRKPPNSIFIPGPPHFAGNLCRQPPLIFWNGTTVSTDSGAPGASGDRVRVLP